MLRRCKQCLPVARNAHRSCPNQSVLSCHRCIYSTFVQGLLGAMFALRNRNPSAAIPICATQGTFSIPRWYKQDPDAPRRSLMQCIARKCTYPLCLDTGHSCTHQRSWITRTPRRHYVFAFVESGTQECRSNCTRPPRIGDGICFEFCGSEAMSFATSSCEYIRQEAMVSFLPYLFAASPTFSLSAFPLITESRFVPRYHAPVASVPQVIDCPNRTTIEVMARTLAIVLISLLSLVLAPMTMAGPIPLTPSPISYASPSSDTAAPTLAFTLGPGPLPHPSASTQAAPSSSSPVLEMDWLS